jgi:hypothetical protein
MVFHGEAQVMTNRDRVDNEECYQIQIAGALDERWSDWFNGLTITVEEGGDGSRLTILTGTLDQSALHGVLGRIRDLNLRLISIAGTCSAGSKTGHGSHS